jgi:hypothetical protein
MNRVTGWIVSMMVIYESSYWVDSSQHINGIALQSILSYFGYCPDLI